MILLDELTLTRRFGSAYLYMRAGDCESRQRVDRNLGLCMSAVSQGVKEIQACVTGYSGLVETEFRVGSINVSSVTLEEGWEQPDWKVLCLVSGRFVYTAGMSRGLDSVLLAFGGALRYFGLKYGVVTVERDGLVRSREKAREQGWA